MGFQVLISLSVSSLTAGTVNPSVSTPDIDAVMFCPVGDESSVFVGI
jgi:hypothetical protein